MKKVEIESFFKSFMLFFASMGILISTIFYYDYTKELSSLDDKLLSKMQVCSYDLNCKEFSFDFPNEQGLNFYTLNKDEKGLHANFPISGSDINALRLSLSQVAYTSKVQKIQKSLVLYFLMILFVVFLLSIIFSLYSLSPLRNALKLTEEFIKDILHDFNTPLSTLRLNSSMLKDEIGPNTKIIRIEQSVQNVLDLQENLRSYLQEHNQHLEEVNLETLLQERIDLFEKNNPEISFKSTLRPVLLRLNPLAFVRIIDNLLSNAVKYNVQKGSVEVIYDKSLESIIIKDSGKGIKNPKDIFKRHYKEQERGLGIGLHIVKKLCEEQGIKIKVKSTLGEGSEFYLDMKALLHK